MSEIFIIKNTGKGVITGLSPENIVPVNTPQEGGGDQGLQEILNTGSEALNIPNLKIQTGELEITSNELTAPNSIKINKNNYYGIQLNSDAQGVKVTSGYEFNVTAIASIFHTTTSFEVLSNSLVKLESANAMQFKTTGTLTIENGTGFIVNTNGFHVIESGNGITLDSNTSAVITGGTSIIYLNNDNITITSPNFSVNPTNVTIATDQAETGLIGTYDYTLNYPTDGTEDLIYPQIKYVKDKISESQSYSTTETKTGGTWVDGKPIYRKVITLTKSEFTNLIGAETDIYAFLPNIKEVVDFKHKCIYDGETEIVGINLGQSYVRINNNVIANGTFIIAYRDSPGNVIDLEESLYDSFTYILEYTKTTD